MPNPDQIPYVKLIKRATVPDVWKDVPILGDVYDAGNAIVDFIESDCRPGWDVYVETLWPALGQAVLVLLYFGLDDVLRGYFRPGGGRGIGGLGRASRRQPRPTARMRAKGALKGGIPELGELFGKNLPGATVVKARNVGSAQKFLWHVDGLAQRGLYYWMIADVTSDFIINWTTGIMESEECIGVEVAGFERQRAQYGLIQNTSTYNVVPCPSAVESYGPITDTEYSLFVPSGFTGKLWISGTVHQVGYYADAQARMGFWVPGSPQRPLTNEPWTPIPEEEPGQRIGSTVTVTGPITVHWGGQANWPNRLHDIFVGGILYNPFT